MLSKLLEALKTPFRVLFENGSVRRFVAFLISLLAGFLLAKFGVDLSPEMQEKMVNFLMLVVSLYLGQSGAVAVAVQLKGKPAAPQSLEEAAAVLRKGPEQ